MTAPAKPHMHRGSVSLLWKREQGAFLKELREKLGLTQMEVARAVGFEDKGMVSAIETGRTNLPPERLAAFCNVLEQDPQLFATRILRFRDPHLFALMVGADEKLRAELRADAAIAEAHKEKRLKATRAARRKQQRP